MRKNKVSFIPPIIEDGKVISEPDKKSEIFNKFFASKCSVPGADGPAPDLPPKEEILESLSSFNTSPIEVAKYFMKLKSQMVPTVASLANFCL